MSSRNHCSATHVIRSSLAVVRDSQITFLPWRNDTLLHCTKCPGSRWCNKEFTTTNTCIFSSTLWISIPLYCILLIFAMPFSEKTRLKVCHYSSISEPPDILNFAHFPKPMCYLLTKLLSILDRYFYACSLDCIFAQVIMLSSPFGTYIVWHSWELYVQICSAQRVQHKKLWWRKERTCASTALFLPPTLISLATIMASDKPHGSRPEL